MNLELIEQHYMPEWSDCQVSYGVLGTPVSIGFGTIYDSFHT